MGTVEADDPMLTARPPGPRIATRVVFCRHRLPSIDSRLIQTASEFPLLLIVGRQINATDLRPLESHKAVIVDSNTDDPTKMIATALDALGGLGMTNLMLEGGGELLASFFAANQIDECHVHIGAKAFGGIQAPGPIAGPGLEKIDDAWSFSLVSANQFDDDLRAVYRKINV
jgi:diaminohydroxyphosphoribosylaminopyrimidine deaminase/5-amino-6-(5-phosphoribosylamino)uracil reductase